MSTKTTALQVCVRLRPLNDKECKAGGEAWTTLPEYQTVCEVGSDGKPIKDSGATFDKVYGGDSTTEEVYAAIGFPLVDNAMNGLNGTIFAYGQTSSGKTFTMQGDNKKRSAKVGFIEMAARQIFDYIQSKPEREFLLRLSYIEIYNEVIRDLLQPNKKLGTNLKIHVNPRSGPYVRSITEVVTDASSIMQALRRGDTMRAVDATDMNERSSRSHTIFKIMLESKERSERRLSGDDDVDGAILESHLNFVDLAGSENVRHTGAEGNRLKEAGRINTSLLTLSRVIKQISSGAGHINFRDSKLTHILQPSLAGNCKTALIACATPSVCFREETRTTLAFAQRAKLIKTCAKVNETLDEDCQLRRMKKDLRDARKKQKKMEEELSKMQSGKAQEELSALRDALAVTQNISLEAKTAKETADKKYENLKNLVLSSVINAGVSRKRDVNAMKARRRRRHSMLPSMLLGMRGSEFARLDEDDEEENTVGGALGLISSVAVASPSLKKAKLQKEADFESAVEADQASTEKQVQTLRFKLDVITSKLETQQKKAEDDTVMYQKELTEAKKMVMQLKISCEASQKMQDDLKGQMKNVQQKNESITAERQEKENALTAQLERVQTENAAFAAKIDEIQTSKEAIANQLTQTTEEVQEVRSLLVSTQEAAKTAADEKIAELQSDAATAQNAKAAAEDRATKLEAENIDLKSKIAENDSMNMEMMSNFEEMVTQLHEATETQSNLSEQLNAKQAQIKDLQLNTSKGTELERQNVELQATIQDLEKSNSDLLETLNETVEKLEEASQVKKNMETDFAEAKAEQQNMSDQLENEVKNLQIKVSEQESINCELKATFDETVGHLEEVTSTKDDLEKKLQAAQAEVTELALNSAASEEVEVLNTQLEQLTATVSTLQDQITQKNNALEEASQNFTTAKQEISVLKENNSVLSFEMQNLEDEKADEETKANEFQQKLTEQQQSIKDMKDQLNDQQTLADETSQEMEEMTADLLAKAEQIKKHTDFIKELETQNAKQEEELLNIQSVTIDVKENLKVVHQRDAAKKELDEVRLALSAEKKAREAAEQAQNAAILEGTTASADSVAMSNKLQTATQQIVELKAEASSKQISWAQRENELNKTAKQNQTDLQDTQQTSKLLQDQLGVANEQLETLRVELEETKDKLQTQVATVNASVNEAAQIQNNEETARKLVLQANTANNLMKQKIEKKELELKESVKRCKEVENMMFTEQKRFSELQDATTATEKANHQKIASLEHDITRLQNQRGQSTAESKRRLEFLEKQNENLVASSKANVEEVVENRKKVANLTMKCERFQQAITKMENRCEELRSEIEEKDSVVTVLQKQVAEHESASLNKIDIEKMEQTNIALRNAVTALEKRVKKQKDEAAAANDRSTEQTNSITVLQLEIESLQAAVEEATATSLDNCLAADLDAALEQRNIAQKKVTELTATLKKDRASKEATKKEVERLKLEHQQVASAAQEATSRASTLEVQLQESEHRVATATAELKVNIAANDKLLQEIKGTKASMEKMEKNQAQVSAVATADAEKVLELQQEIEFQNTLLSENDSEVQALKKINHEAKEQLKQQNFQLHSMVDKHNAECRQLETSIDSWSRKYATHKAKALEQYEAVANEAARLGTVEADLRTQVSSLSTKVRDQSSMLREQRNAIAKTQTQSSQTSMKTIELLKTEIQNERARNADKDQRIAKLEQVKLSKHQVQKLMIMKQEHKKFKKENKRLKETVENLACGSKDHSTGSGSNSDDYQRIKSLTQEMEQLRDTTDVANMEVENVKDQLRQHQQAAAEVEKENIQLKDKLLHADISMAQGYKEKEAQYLKEIKYLENENLELMEEISSLRDAAVRRDESVTLNIPSLTKFLADSPAARKPSTDMMSASPAIVGKRTPLSIRAQPNPNIASSATRSMKKTLGTSNSLKKTRINESLDPSPSVQNSSVIPVHEDEIDVDGPGECNTQ